MSVIDPEIFCMVQGESVDGFYFLEEGQALFSTTDEDGMEINTGILEPGMYFGVNAFYAEQPARFSVRATSVGVIQHLTADALLNMETEHPPLAIVLHRLLAAQIGHRAERVEELTKVLQRQTSATQISHLHNPHALAQAWIQRAPNAIAQKIEGDHNRENGHTGKGRHPPLVEIGDAAGPDSWRHRVPAQPISQTISTISVSVRLRD